MRRDREGQGVLVVASGHRRGLTHRTIDDREIVIGVEAACHLDQRGERDGFFGHRNWLGPSQRKDKVR